MQKSEQILAQIKELGEELVAVRVSHCGKAATVDLVSRDSTVSIATSSDEAQSVGHRMGLTREFTDTFHCFSEDEGPAFVRKETPLVITGEECGNLTLQAQNGTETFTLQATRAVAEAHLRIG